jgi:hypothetical protein
MLKKIKKKLIKNKKNKLKSNAKTGSTRKSNRNPVKLILQKTGIIKVNSVAKLFTKVKKLKKQNNASLYSATEKATNLKVNLKVFDISEFNKENEFNFVLVSYLFTKKK